MALVQYNVIIIFKRNNFPLIILLENFAHFIKNRNFVPISSFWSKKLTNGAFQKNINVIKFCTRFYLRIPCGIWPSEHLKKVATSDINIRQKKFRNKSEVFFSGEIFSIFFVKYLQNTKKNQNYFQTTRLATLLLTRNSIEGNLVSISLGECDVIYSKISIPLKLTKSQLEIKLPFDIWENELVPSHSINSKRNRSSVKKLPSNSNKNVKHN